MSEWSSQLVSHCECLNYKIVALKDRVVEEFLQNSDRLTGDQWWNIFIAKKLDCSLQSICTAANIVLLIIRSTAFVLFVYFYKRLRFHDDGPRNFYLPGRAYILKTIPVWHESGPVTGCRALTYVGPWTRILPGTNSARSQSKRIVCELVSVHTSDVILCTIRD